MVTGADMNMIASLYNLGKGGGAAPKPQQKPAQPKPSQPAGQGDPSAPRDAGTGLTGDNSLNNPGATVKDPTANGAGSGGNDQGASDLTGRESAMGDSGMAGGACPGCGMDISGGLGGLGGLA